MPGKRLSSKQVDRAQPSLVAIALRHPQIESRPANVTVHLPVDRIGINLADHHLVMHQPAYLVAGTNKGAITPNTIAKKPHAAAGSEVISGPCSLTACAHKKNASSDTITSCQLTPTTPWAFAGVLATPRSTPHSTRQTPKTTARHPPGMLSAAATAIPLALTPSWSAPLMVDSFARAGKTDPPLSSHPLADLGG
jgi:hypothetical protein